MAHCEARPRKRFDRTREEQRGNREHSRGGRAGQHGLDELHARDALKRRKLHVRQAEFALHHLVDAGKTAHLAAHVFADIQYLALYRIKIPQRVLYSISLGFLF